MVWRITVFKNPVVMIDPKLRRVLLIYAYIVFIMGIDSLAAWGVQFPFDWRVLRWRNSFYLDWFKLLFWTLLPICMVFRDIDWHYFTTKRWKKVDVYLLIGFLLIGVVIAYMIRYVPALDAEYHSRSSRSLAGKFRFFWTAIVLALSWLPGWEFLFRYLLLRRIQECGIRFLWLLIPLSEFVYHLQKPFIEAVGILIFSLFFTQWAMIRRNTLLPLLAHLLFEMEVMLSMLIH